MLRIFKNHRKHFAAGKSSCDLILHVSIVVTMILAKILKILFWLPFATDQHILWSFGKFQVIFYFGENSEKSYI